MFFRSLKRIQLCSLDQKHLLPFEHEIRKLNFLRKECIHQMLYNKRYLNRYTFTSAYQQLENQILIFKQYEN